MRDGDYLTDDISSPAMKKYRSSTKQDFLDEMISERSRRNPKFPQMLEAALGRRRLLRTLAERREQLGLTQTTVAERMETSQSAVARIEAGEIDAKLSTVERYAAAIGQRVQWRVVSRPATQGQNRARTR
jgi:ribosome-binding protein aMBF1 (putative translation factor)